eukprot:m.281254 g.281254  ORF g.281254 m.281254 type:complete len:77 (-) comp15751_c6_seq10:125-355(-)
MSLTPTGAFILRSKWAIATVQRCNERGAQYRSIPRNQLLSDTEYVYGETIWKQFKGKGDQPVEVEAFQAQGGHKGC